MLSDTHFERQENRLSQLEQYTVLTPQDIMDILNIGKNSAYALLNSGQLRGFRVGRSWRVPTEALEEFMLTSPRKCSTNHSNIH